MTSTVVKGVTGIEVRRTGRGYNNISYILFFKQYRSISITKYFDHLPRFNGAFSRDSLLRINVLNFNDKRVKEHIRFDSLLMVKQL